MKDEHAFNEPAFDGAIVEAWLKAAADKLAQNRATINYFNHFPVADSDTGTNMLATLEAALEAIDHLHGKRDLEAVTAAAARGALLGARGNSGVILSQMLQALASHCEGRPRLREVDLVDAFAAMAAGARQAVSEPVEGTILTALDRVVPAVLDYLPQLAGGVAPPGTGGQAGAGLGANREAGGPHSGVEAPTAALDANSVERLNGLEELHPTIGLIVLTATLAVADSIYAVEEGPTPYPDAGTIGLGVILAALSQLYGADPVYPDVFQRMLTDLPEQWGGQSETPSADEFEVMYLLDATAATAQAVRQRLTEIGNSVAVTGAEDEIGGGLWQVHVHTRQPLAALLAPRDVQLAHGAPSGLFASLPEEYSGRLSAQLGWVASNRFADLRHVCVRYLQPVPWLSAAEDPVSALSSRAGVRMLERSRHGAARTAAPQSAGLVAITRSPGLVEQLARTGAVVVLLTSDVAAHSRSAIDRAALETGAPVVAVIPCDAAAADVATSLDRSYRRGHLHRRATRLFVAPSRNEMEMLTVTLAQAAPLPVGLGMAGQEAELAERARAALARLRTVQHTGHVEEAELVESLRELLRDEPEVITFLVSGDAERALADQFAERLQDLTDRSLYSGGLERTDRHGLEQMPQSTFSDLDVVVVDAGTDVPGILLAAE